MHRATKITAKKRRQPNYLPGTAGAVAAGTFTESNTETDDFLLEAIVSTTEVHIKIRAKIAVNLLIALKAVGLANKLSAPDAPKIPAAEPLPLCKRTSKIKRIQTIKCKIKVKVYICKSPIKNNTFIIQFFFIFSRSSWSCKNRIFLLEYK